MFILWVKNYHQNDTSDIPLVEGLDLKLKRTKYQSPSFFESVKSSPLSDYGKSNTLSPKVDFNLHINLTMLKQKLKTFSSDVQCHALKQKTKPPSYDQVSPPPTYDEAMFMWDIQYGHQGCKVFNCTTPG